MNKNDENFIAFCTELRAYVVIDINYNANDLVGIVRDKTIHLSGYVSEKSPQKTCVS